MTSTDKQELPKTFDPSAIEAKWYPHWEETNAFRPERPDAAPYTIVNPPPNVTGSLHIGHALDNTLQDIMIRYERLRGKDALWVVGTDHAGIATQMVVERQLEAAQDKRTNYSREDFVKKVWEWKEESGGQITRQLRRLGCSMDWSREQFTMDPHFSKAVLKVFVDLYNQGLIYRDKRLVNWDPKLKTAISDLEVETREMQGSFWHFRYPLADGVTLDDGRDHIVVATTRPETMLADMAVAVNGEDPRYASVIGKFVELPITGRRIPIVADDHADPELGSGAVKITPGHDFNDFEVGRRAGIAASDMLNMFDAEAKVVQTADGLIPAEFVGVDRFDARKLVVEQMKALGRLVPHTVTAKDGDVTEHDAEPRTIQTPYGDRGGVVIEPWLTDQWYVDAKTLAQPAIEAVKTGVIEIVPKSWEKTFFHWMDNIQPWCVSRQLWWGHRIPAWYGSDGKCYVAETEEEARALVGEGVTLARDSDVLDTWFSSALWPFATLGWPQDGADAPLVAKHYPNDLLISGFDILFFWDARMAMMGTHFMGAAPWKQLYLHGLVRAADGAKMSKSKGNTVDPLGLIDQYGADALRFFMAAMESQGRDIKMDERRVEGYRNFATKLWNAARFCQSNGIGASASITAPQATLAVNRWIIGEVVDTVAALDKALADLRFDAAANAIYHFVWDQFCDWYLELIKPVLSAEGDTGEATETRRVAGWVLDQILVMLHPFMPFITEELWHALGERAGDLIVAEWPQPEASVDVEAKAETEWIIDLISQIRSARSDSGIPPGKVLSLSMNIEALGTKQSFYLERNRRAVERVARVSFDRGVWFPPNAPTDHPSFLKAIEQVSEQIRHGSLNIVLDGFEAFVSLDGIIDIAAEKTRLTKALEAVSKEAKSLEGRLSNPAFVEKAKPEAVEKARADHAEKSAEAERLAAALARLG
ncbi:valine--tRNA ligase [Blastomonas sp. RAC04]|uniref:valine--tRNA ligase n=2 Tax=Blastomonas TaxID=150203 RepID=UPI00083D599F|nr:valine--tRNA ligase [Blastomonas sp. RAC04]AOF99392.1 valine--tRNA ligase [Blastomonas sp. RAC04]